MADIKQIKVGNTTYNIEPVTAYLPLTGGTVTGELIMSANRLWIQGGSAAGSNSNRLTTSSGMPGDMQYNNGKRGLQLYSNGIALADPYNGNANNDSAWIRHLETTVNAGLLEIAAGDDAGNEEIRFRYYDTSNNIAHDILVPKKTGTIALTSDIPTSLPANGGNADTLDGKHSSDFYLSSSNITNLPINGGIYWNSYVESSSDGSDAASITVIRDGNGSGGTVLQIKQANDNNDIVNVVAGDLKLNGVSVSTNGHTHSSVTDIGNSTATTFAYSKSGLNYGDYTWLAGWNGYELRAVNKSQFATSGHTHDDRYYTESEINTKLNGKSNTNHTHNYLPLSGGTMDGTLIFSKDSNGIKFASDAWYITNIEAGYTSVQIGTAAAGYTTSVTVTFKDYKHGSGSWYVVATVAGNNPAQPECVIAGISDLTTSGVKIRVRKIANNSGTGNPVWNINWIAIKYW